MWMTITMNLIILKGKFSDLLKISQTTPTLKPKKNPRILSSYKPICNMQIFQKILEEILKRKLSNYLEYNNLIQEEHHCGRSKHSTVTARAVSEEASIKNMDKNKLGLLVSTHLIVEYNTVYTKILIQKIKFLGLNRRMLEILKTYLTN